MPESSKCKLCGKPVLWAKNENKNVICLDPAPSQGGDVVIVDGIAHTVRGDLFEQRYEGPRYTNHYATCSGTKDGRKKPSK